MTRITAGAFAYPLAFAIGLIACGGDKAPEGDEGANLQPPAAMDGADVVYVLNAADSSIQWRGSKLYETDFHVGTVAPSSASLALKDGDPAAGKLVIDMTTIQNTDIEDPEYNAKLTNHLKDSDFFNVTKHPEAEFEIVSVEKTGEGEYLLTGNLTVKDITREIQSAATITEEGDGLRVRSVLKLDRTEHGVEYNSENYIADLARDKVIDDMIELTLDLALQKQ